MICNMTDIFSLLDESTIEAMAWDEEKTVIISLDKLKKHVRNGIYNENEKKRAMVPKLLYNSTHNTPIYGMKWRARLIVILIIIAIAAVPVYALVNYRLHKSSIVDEENCYLIGSQIEEDYYIIMDENGECTDSLGNKGSLEDMISLSDLPNKSRIVTNVENTDIKPSSYVEIKYKKHSGNIYTYPRLILVNNSVCILTGNDGKGWDLNEGESITVEISKESAKRSLKQNLLVGYIQDGTLKDGKSIKENSGSYTVKADAAGTYYIYLLSASSDYLTVNSLSIEVVQ